MIEPAGSPGRAGTATTPQLALRVAILGGIAFALFAIVFLRLWFLQVLSGDQYRQEALDNRVRLVAVPAPRGAIVDRSGTPIVENREATVIQLDPRRLPASERDAAAAWGQKMGERAARPKGHHGPPVPIPKPTTPELASRLARLAAVLGVSPARVQASVIQQLAVLPYANVRVKVDVPETVRDFLLERQRDFPGIAVERVYLRRYPLGPTAAQLLGSVGQISPQELGTQAYRGVRQGAVVGQGGLEQTYDRYLRGTDGVQSITVDASGRPKSSRLSTQPQPGDQLRTSLDLGLQRVGQTAMQNVIGSGTGTAGAFVALDPRNGRVLAMGSFPTFDPNVLARPITQARYDQIFGPQAGAPAFDRAIAGAYPTGSTFKPITAIAALERGIITPDTPVDDPGVFVAGTQKFYNAGKVANGVIALRRALQISSDVFFYRLGSEANALGPVIQTWARKLSLDHPTGIDLPGEAGGTIPDRAWRARQDAKEVAYEKKHHNQCPPNCLYSDKRPWSVGDNIQLAVGQGDVQASPLQMAVAYATLENGGTVVRPHLGLTIQSDTGSPIQEIDTPPARHVQINGADRQAVLDGLHMATMGDGTSADVFAGWNQSAYPVFGKTGTAQRSGHLNDQSWYVAFVPDPKRPIVIATTVEDGGWGAEAAAPITCVMLSHWYGQKAACSPGKSRTK